MQNPPHRRPFVLVMLSTVQKARRDKLAGIYRAARGRGWDLRVVERHPFAPSLQDLLHDRLPDGAIVDGDGESGALPDALARHVPVVYLDRNSDAPDEIIVNHDSAATARAVADYLVGLGLRHFAFVGTSPSVWWSEIRAQVFREAVQTAGGTYDIYAPARTKAREGSRLRNWLAELPRPCGVFAAMDIRASTVLESCSAVGLRVPDEIAVIGVDNDELLCESRWPALSSIQPDFQRAGELAVELLDNLLNGRTIPSSRHTYGPARIVVRESTRRLGANAARIRPALAFIRQNARAGIGVQDVVNVLGVSRRTMELSFRRATGQSILEAIQATRLDAVCRLLAETDTPIGLIAESCGYRSDTYLKNLFKRRFGQSMRAYRNTARTS